MRAYEVVIIGAGPAGYQAAFELGKAGIKTLLIEKSKEHIGGVCLNVGCIPAKNYLESASFVSKIPYFRECGVGLEFHGLNLEQLKSRTTALIDEIRTGILWMLEQSKVDILYGSASFVDNKTVEVDGESIAFEKAIIATGSTNRLSDSLPIDGKSILSSSDIFELERLPKSIAIVGTGPIGCEMATFFDAVGVEVTLIGRSSRLLSSEDEEVSKALLRVFKKSSITLFTSTTVARAELHSDGVELWLNTELDGANQQESIKCELVLSAIGRVPRTEGLSLDRANVKQDERGFVEVSPSFESSQEGIYAIGDTIDTPAFAHTAYAEAKILANNIISGKSETNTHLSPSTIFTNPPIASCGLKESDAKAQGVAIEVKKAYFKVNAKAKIHGDDAGFVKVLLSAESKIIIGATIIGVDATEIIHELLLAIEQKLTLKQLKETIHAHPTVSEIMIYL